MYSMYSKYIYTIYYYFFCFFKYILCVNDIVESYASIVMVSGIWIRK